MPGGEEYLVALGHIPLDQDPPNHPAALKKRGLWSGFKQIFVTKPRARPRRQFSNDLQSLGYNCLGSAAREDEEQYRQFIHSNHCAC